MRATGRPLSHSRVRPWPPIRTDSASNSSGPIRTVRSGRPAVSCSNSLKYSICPELSLMPARFGRSSRARMVAGSNSTLEWLGMLYRYRGSVDSAANSRTYAARSAWFNGKYGGGASTTPCAD